MERELKIYDMKKALHVTKDSGTKVWYHLEGEYEIHLNYLPPHCEQEWHYHKKLQEMVYVLKGELVCKWVQNNEIITRTIYQHQLIEVNESKHTFVNLADFEAIFLVFRIVPDFKDKRNIFKNDKIMIDSEYIKEKFS